MQDKFRFYITLIFALFLMAFGFFGYHKTGSLMSLYSSLTFGVLLLGACFGMFAQKKWGSRAATLLTALLTLMFAYRAIMTHKPVPSRLALVSFVLFCFLFYKERFKRQH